MSSLVAQQVEDLALLLQQFRSLLWCGFNPWPRNFQVQPKQKANKKTPKTNKNLKLHQKGELGTFDVTLGEHFFLAKVGVYQIRYIGASGSLEW